MKVPKYENTIGLSTPTVAAPKIPLPDMSTSSEIQGARNLQKIGSTIGDIVKGVSSAMQTQQDRVNEQKLAADFGAASQELSDTLLSNEVDTVKNPDGSERTIVRGTLNRQLGDTKGISQQFNNDAFKIYSKYEGTFKDPIYQQKFSEMFGREVRSKQAIVNKHEATELQKNNDAIFESSIANMYKNSSSIQSVNQASLGMQNVSDLIQSYGKSNGWAPEVISEKTIDTQKKLIEKAAMDSLVADPEGRIATNILSVDGISDSDRGELTAKVLKRSREYQKELKQQKVDQQNATFIKLAQELLNGNKVSEENVDLLVANKDISPSQAVALKNKRKVVPLSTEEKDFVKKAELIYDIDSPAAQAEALRDLLEDNKLSDRDMTMLAQEAIKHGADLARKKEFQHLSFTAKSMGLQEDNIIRDYMKNTQAGMPPQEASDKAFADEIKRQSNDFLKEKTLEKDLDRSLDLKNSNDAEKSIFQYLFKSGVDISEAAETATQIVTPSIVPDQKLATSVNILERLFKSVPIAKINSPKLAAVYENMVKLNGFAEKMTTRHAINFASGFMGSTSDVFRGMEAFIPSNLLGKNLCRFIADKADEVRERIEPKNQKFEDMLFSGAGSMASLVIPGLGVAKGIQAAKLAPRLAMWLGSSASAVLEAMAEGGGTFDRLKKKGKTDQEATAGATKTFWMNLPTIVFTNKLGIFADKGGMIKKAAISSPVEGFQEWTQSLIGNFAANDPLFEGALDSALVGAVLGPVASAGVSLATKEGGPTNADQGGTKVEGPSPEETPVGEGQAKKTLKSITVEHFNQEKAPLKVEDIKVEPELVSKANQLQEALGKEIVISSGYRTQEYNADLKKRGYKPAENSLHLSGRAMDIDLKKSGLTHEQVIEAAEKIGLDVEDITLTPKHVHLELPTEGSPTKLFKRNLSNESGSVPIPGFIEKIAGALDNVIDPQKRQNLYQKTVNRFDPIEEVAKVARAAGETVAPGKDPGLSAMKYLGSASQAKSILEKGTYKIGKEGNVISTGEGMKPILNEYDSSSIEMDQEVRNQDLNDYLISRRTIEDLQRKARPESEGNIVSQEQVAAAQEKLDQISEKYGDNIKNLENTATRIYDYQRRVLSMLTDSGLLSKKQFDEIVAANPHYIPFDRVLPEEFLGGTPIKKSPFSGVKNPVKRIQGSEKEIQDVLGSVFKNTYQIVDRASRNKVFQDVYDLRNIEELGIKSVKPNMIPIKVDEDQTIFRPSAFRPSGNVIEGYIDGKRKYIEVSQNLFEAMSGLNETSSNLLIKILSKPAHMLRTGATLTPEFIERNIIRDQFTAFIQTQVGFKPFADAFAAVGDIVNQSDAYTEWIRSGGAYAGFVEVSRPSMIALVDKMRNDKSFDISKLNIIKNLQDFSQLMEQATRVGVYKRARAKGLSAIEAARISREGTLDFARRGTGVVRDWNSIVPFFNAGIQGFDTMVRNAKKDPGGTLTKAIATITIPSVLLHLINRMHPDYDELPQWRKDLFWNFKVGGKWWSVPKPFGYGQVFGSLPERFLQYAETRNPESFEGIAKSLYESLSPVAGDPMSGLMPTAIKPLIENKVNWNFFRERKIVPEWQTDLIPEEQIGKFDSETSKVLGKIFKVSPSKIENLVSGWSGGAGRYALQLGDIGVKALRKAGGVEPPPKRPADLADIPVIKGFASRDPVGFMSQSVSEFYKIRDEIRTLKATRDKYESSDRVAESDKLSTESPEVDLYSEVERAGKEIGALAKEVDSLIADKEISPAERKAAIKELEQTMVTVAQDINREVKALRKK